MDEKSPSKGKETTSFEDEVLHKEIEKTIEIVVSPSNSRPLTPTIAEGSSCGTSRVSQSRSSMSRTRQRFGIQAFKKGV